MVMLMMAIRLLKVMIVMLMIFFYDGNDARRGAILGPARVTPYRANFLSISIL